MAEWVDSTGTSGFFSTFETWVADMGPYIGTWPMQPPGVMGGNPDSDLEMRFVVMEPNPTDASPTAAGDGSYPCQIWQSWRYPPSQPDYGFEVSWAGAATSPSYMDEPPAGVHLYVMYWGNFPASSDVPPFGPEHYVPVSYAASGAAAFETAPGQWLEQPGFDFEAEVPPGTTWSGGGDYGFDSGHQTPGYDIDLGALLTSEFTANAILVPPRRNAGGAGSTIQAIQMDKEYAPNGFGPPFVDAQANFQSNWAALNYDATTVSLPEPSQVLTMTYGVDYGPAPETALGWQYQSAEPVAVEWLSFVPRLTFQSAPTTIIGPPDQEFLYGWSRADPSVNLPPVMNEFFSLWISGGVQSDTVSIPAEIASDMSMWLLCVPAVHYGGFAPPDVAMPPGPGAGDNGYGFRADVDFSPGSRVDATITTPHWQYYIPGKIVPTAINNLRAGAPLLKAADFW